MLAPDVATATAERIVLRIRKVWGGEKHYVRCPSKRQRNQQIIQDWLEQRANGCEDRRALACKYELSLDHITRLIGKYLRRKTTASSDFAPDNWWI